MREGQLYWYGSLQSTTELDRNTSTSFKKIYGDLDVYIEADVTQQTGSVDCLMPWPAS